MRYDLARFTQGLMFCLGLAVALVLIAPAPAVAACSESVLFQTATARPVGTKVNRLALADLNGDGILDLVGPMPESLTGVYANTIAVMLGGGSGGVGNGTFGTPSTWTVGTRPVDVAIYDLNADGKLDIVVGNWASNSVSMLYGNGDGTFAAAVNIACGTNTYTPVMVDLNHDGVLDLAVANNGAASVTVRLGLGGGSYAAAVSYPIGGLSMSLVTGDLNHDGNADLVASAYSNGISVLLGKGDGTFHTAQTYATGGEAYALALRDFNGDGDLDLAVTNTNVSGVDIFLGNGLGGFSTPTVYGNNAINGTGLAVADYDGDGISDLAVCNTVNNAVVILKGQGSGGTGNGTFAIHSSYPVTDLPTGLAVGNFNGDGLADLAVAGFGTSGVESILLGSCAAPPPPREIPHLVSVRDVPNDQGGQVFLRWTHSSLDTAGIAAITGYRVWRRLPLTAAAAARQALATGASNANLRAVTVPTSGGFTAVEYWEAVATLPAEQFDGNGYTAATVQDSMAGSNPYTAFFVTALTRYTSVFYQSNVDSGYSVDNLAPAEPHPFVAQSTPAGLALRWGAGQDPDIAGYLLYRGGAANFVPGPGSLIASLADTEYVDPTATGSVYYKVCATDRHGNASPYSAVSAMAATPALRLALAGARPNPATGDLTVAFTLPSSVPASLEVLDLAGRRVILRSVGPLGPGYHVLNLTEGRRIPVGVYLLRLTQGPRSLSARAVLVR